MPPRRLHLAGIAAWTFAGTQGGTSVQTHGVGSPAAVGGWDVTIGILPPPPAAPQQPRP